MNTIGQVLKAAREKKNISFSKLSDSTKIKKSFLVALEKEDWEKLPEAPIVSGFVRSISAHLDIQPQMASALLRRDYPPKVLSMAPKPDLKDKFTWTPRMTFGFFAGMFIVGILTYLFIEYRRFVTPPKLSVVKPYDGEIVYQGNIEVTGVTDTDASLFINNQPSIVDENGNFSEKIDLEEDTASIYIKAVSRSGKETLIERNIQNEIGN